MLPSPLKQWLILMGLAAVYCATQVGIAHHGDGRHYALAVQMARKGTIDVGPLWYATGAPDPQGERLILTHRPGAAILAMPFYLGGGIVQGAFPESREIFFDIRAQVTLVASACAMAATALLIFFCCLELGCRPPAAYLAMAGFAFTTLALPYGGRLNSETFAAFTILLFTYTYLRLRGGWDTPAQGLGLGFSLFLAPLVHDLTLLAWPILLLLVLLNSKQIFSSPSRVLSIFLPALLGALVFLAYNKAAFGGPGTGPGGGFVLSELYDRYTAASVKKGLVTLLYAKGDSVATLAEVFRPPRSFGEMRPAGLLLAMPQLCFALFGILNLRREPITRRPLYILLLILGLWLVLAAGRLEPLSDFDKDASVLLPFIALCFILIGSFIDYHLMTMKGSLTKLVFRLAFVYCCVLGLSHATATVMTRNAGHPKPQLLYDIFPETPKTVSKELNYKQAVALLFPSLANLLVLLPFAALPLGVPMALRILTKKAKRKRSRGKKAGAAQAHQPKLRTKPLTDKGRYEALLAKRTLDKQPAQEPIQKRVQGPALPGDDRPPAALPRAKKVYKFWDDLDGEDD